MNGMCKTSGTPSKGQTYELWVLEEGEEVWTKVRGNLFRSQVLKTVQIPNICTHNGVLLNHKEK
jgi:hypothetical protein